MNDDKPRFLHSLLLDVGGLPGLDNPMGFAFSVVSMISTAVVLLLYFRWKRWL